MRERIPGVRLACAVIACLGFTVCVSAQTASVTNQLRHYRSVYEAELKKILDDGKVRSESWPDDYIREVMAIRSKAQRSGDLDAVMAVDAELKRFRDSKSIPDQVIAVSPEAIRAIQVNYRDRPRLLALDCDQKVLEFTARYKERLSAMQSELTKADKIVDAMLVNSEIKRLASSPAVTAAEFAMAEEETRRKKAEASAAPPAAQTSSVPPRAVGDVAARPPPPVVPRPAVPPEPKKSDELASGFKLIEKSTGLGTPMKPLPMTATSQLRIPKVRVDIAMDEREPGDTSSGGGTYGSYRSRSGNTKLVFQATVKSTSTNEYEGTKMVVQYFTKQASTRVGGKIDPQEALKIMTPLPKVASQPVLVECPPFQYWSSTSKYRSAYYSSNYKSGDDFYGAIVSVFDDDGKLLFQGASMNSLDKMGVDAP